MTRWTAMLACLAAMIPADVWAAQGLVVVQRVTVDGAASTNEVQLTSQKMRADIDSPNGRQTVIFDSTKQVLYVINPGRKTYVEMTKADVDQLGAMMAQAAQMMQSMPPEQRAQLEAMMKGRGMQMPGSTAAKPEYRKGGTQKVGKWTCDVYEMTTAGQKTGEVCTVSPQAMGFGPADFEVTRQMAEFIRGLTPEGADNIFQIGRPEQQGFSGVPVRRVANVFGRETVSELTDTRRQDVPDSTFAVPADFTKLAPGGGVFGGRGRGPEPGR